MACIALSDDFLPREDPRPRGLVITFQENDTCSFPGNQIWWEIQMSCIRSTTCLHEIMSEIYTLTEVR